MKGNWIHLEPQTQYTVGLGFRAWCISRSNASSKQLCFISHGHLSEQLRSLPIDCTRSALATENIAPFKWTSTLRIAQTSSYGDDCSEFRVFCWINTIPELEHYLRYPSKKDENELEDTIWIEYLLHSGISDALWHEDSKLNKSKSLTKIKMRWKWVGKSQINHQNLKSFFFLQFALARQTSVLIIV